MTSLENKTVGDAQFLPPNDNFWSRNFILLCLVNFFMFISTQMLFPNVPLFLLTIGGDTKDVGYVMGVYTMSAMMIRPIAGWWVDKHSRSRVMIFGIFLMFLTCLLYNWAVNVAVMTLIRILHGMVFGLASTAIATIVVDSLPVARLNEGMGYFGLTSTLSMAIAPMIGFWVVGNFSYAALFAGIAIMTGLAFLISWLVKSPPVPVYSSGTAASSLWSSLVEETALPAAWVMFFLAAVYGALLSYISLYALEQGITNVGLFFTATALAMLLTRPIAGRWADGGGSAQVLLLGHVVIAIGMLTTSLSHAMNGFILAGLLNGIGFGACMPVLQAQAVMDTPIHRRGAATSTFFALFDLGIGLGTVMWGYIAAASSYQIMYYVTLLPVALAGAVCYRNLQPRSRN